MMKRLKGLIVASMCSLFISGCAAPMYAAGVSSGVAGTALIGMEAHKPLLEGIKNGGKKIKGMVAGDEEDEEE